MAVYTYSVADDTANGVVAPAELHKEIAISHPIDFEGVKVEGDVLEIFYTNALSAEDETALGVTVSVHTGVSTAIDRTCSNCKNFDPIV
jgi:hypothetical protein